MTLKPTSFLMFAAQLAFSFYLAVGVTVVAAQPPIKTGTSRVLFDFDHAETSEKWRIVNDDVMGGRSSSKLTISEDGIAKFSGELSLENNGGFASIRSRPKKLDLKLDQKIALRVRGDGRRYNLNLYVPRRQTAFSYQAEFETCKGEWIQIDLPLSEFVATSFGRRVEGDTLDPSQVEAIGVLLSDKLAGRFELLIDWVRIDNAE